MKREDFVIDGIPEGYQVYDVDLTPAGEQTVTLGHHADRAQSVFVRWHGSEIQLPDDSLSPIVRAAGDDHLVVTERRARNDETINGWIWNSEGEQVSAFHAGDDVEEVLANDDVILLFYGDEGQTGDISLSRKAMVVMSCSGHTLGATGVSLAERKPLTLGSTQLFGKDPTKSQYLLMLTTNAPLFV